MKLTKLGNRTIAGSKRAYKKTLQRKSTDQQVSHQRIVVIKNGEFVAEKPSR